MFASLGGQTVFIALFGAAIREEFGLSPGEYGLLYTLATLGSAVCLVWAGTLVDRFSARRIAVASVVGLSLVALIMAGANSAVILVLALFGLRFFGQGMLSHNSATAMSRWFNRFRGRALAFAQLGFSAGEAVLPIVVALGIAVLGWRQVWLVSAAVLMCLLAPLLWWCFRDPPDGARARARGEANPDGETSGVRSGSHWTRRRVLADPLFWCLLAGIIAMPAISTAIFFHQTTLVAEKGWNPIAFAASFPVLALTSVLASLVAGWLVDQFGAWRLLPAFLLPLCAASLVLWLGQPELTIPLFFLLMGISGGMANATVNAVLAEIYGTAHLGAIRALVTATMVLASALGPGIVGVLIDAGLPLATQAPGFALHGVAVSALYFLLTPRLSARIRSL